MNHYHYKCSQCNSSFSKTTVEAEFIYLCPDCGKAEKNRPLEGVLLIEYDYAAIAKKVKAAAILDLKPGSFWDFPWLYPLEYDKPLVKTLSHSLAKLILNQHPTLIQKIDDRQIYIFDDSRNPTLSFKDRASTLVALKAKQLGITEIAAASTGNAGSSLAGICARLGLKSHIFAPAKIPEAKRLQIQAYGANIYLVDGDYDQAFDL
ncbi:MAG: pyridoxal-phosphate dependent enzyme, partial [bacterium]|nr:pyridoxal-phosphate dependent enzyme [bacterium]